jgi:hypothetical protein
LNREIAGDEKAREISENIDEQRRRTPRSNHDFMEVELVERDRMN